MNPASCPVDESFDPLSPTYLADPYTVLATLPHNEQPIFYAPVIGYYVLTRYDDIPAVFRDPASFSAAVAQAPLGPITEQAQEISAVPGTSRSRPWSAWTSPSTPDCASPPHVRSA